MNISVIIPVRNGQATLHKCLSSIMEQTIKSDIELVVLDSMSTDDSCEIAENFGARVIEIAEGSFNHGLTRNIGVKHAQGEFIFFTVQDAWLGSNDLLERMVKHFQCSEVMAVGGHQAIPHEADKNPFLWYRPVSAPEVQERIVNDRDAFRQLSQANQQSLVSWDNVVAMYRRTALLIQPFETTAFAEDWIWSYYALLRGWKLVYDSSILVYHYHHQNFKYAFTTSYTINYHFYKFFKYKPEVPGLLIPVMQSTYHLLRKRDLSFRKKIFWILYNGISRLARFFSVIDFLIRLKTMGEKGIEKGYRTYCKAVPQGQLKS